MSRARVLLIHPQGSNWIPGRKDVTRAANVMVPLGLCSIAAHLERRGCRVRVLDFFARPTRGSGWLSAVGELDPHWIGFSCTTSSFLDGIRQARAVRAVAPRALIVFGGVHLSARPEEMLRRFPEIDLGVVGEGEAVMADLVDGRPSERIPGLVWRRDGQVVFNGRRDPLPDLDALPPPAYHLLEGFPRRYALPLMNYPAGPGATMASSRGCMYRCSYCDRSVFLRSFRALSAEAMLDQVRFLSERYGIRHVNFYDDLFTYHRERVLRFAEGLARDRTGRGGRRAPTFNCAASTAHVDPEMLKALAEAGCWMISVGAETGDPELLRRHKGREEGLEELRRLVRDARRQGLRVKGLFMMGLPGETPESFRRTMDFILSLGLDDMNLARFTPFPGAPIWADVRQEGSFDEDWSRMNCMNFVFVPRGYRDRAQMESLYNECIRRFYRAPAVRRAQARLVARHPHHGWRLLRDMPRFWAARREFSRG